MQAIQKRVHFGFARAARRLGTIGRHYRVIDLRSPLNNPLGRPYLCFDQNSGFQMIKPRMWARPMVYLLCDVPCLSIGDFLQIGDRFYFVVEIESYRPPLCVACNSAIAISGMRGAPHRYVENCPASITLTGKGEDQRSGMPGSVPAGSYLLHLPVLPGFSLMSYMHVTDASGASYVVESVEISQNGTRAILSVQQI